MKYRLEICSYFDPDEEGASEELRLWQLLGTYPDRCRAEIMQAAHDKVVFEGIRFPMHEYRIIAVPDDFA